MADNFAVKDSAGTAKTVAAKDVSSVWYMRHIQVDGSANEMPSMDAAARAGYVTLTDGTNTAPTMDVAARAGFIQVTNGTINLGVFAEDAAHSSGHTGLMPLGVRNDTHTNGLSGSDGDYTPLATDASGKLGIRGTFAEDAGHSSGDLGLQVLTVRQDTAAALGGTDADYQPFITDASGRLHVNVGAFTPGTAAGSLGKAEDAGHTTGDTGVMMLAVANATHTAALSGTDADYTPIAVDNTGKVGIRGTFAEDAAHSSGDLGINVLCRRIDVCASSAGTSGDYATFNQDANGRMWVRTQDDGPSWTSVSGVAGIAFTSADASASPADVTDAPTSGQKIVVTDLVVSVGAAMAVTFTEETSGDVIAKLFMAANTTQTIKPRGKLKLAVADKKLMVQTSASGNIAVMPIYYSEA